MEYIVGQRWVSHADAQLGLGIVVHMEGRRVTLNFPAVGEERTYATDNAPLTRLRFKAGDHVSTTEGVELLVTVVEEQHGILLYTGTDHHEEKATISELELDAFVQLTTPQQRLLNGHFDKNGDGVVTPSDVIALINELSIIFDRLDIDTINVLEAAGTKWNFLPFKPGLVGGHCIGVDPYYLAQKAQESGYNPEIILAGRRMNDGMGAWVASQVVKLLIKKGADVNIKDTDGETPLHVVAHGNKNDKKPIELEVAKLLIEKGADINAKNEDRDYQTPLCYAASHNRVELAKLLIEKGADVNNDVNAIAYAARRNSVEVAELLIKHRADVHAKNKDGNTPLYTAANNYSVEVAKLLIKHGGK